jgi:hypothetical protein
MRGWEFLVEWDDEGHVSEKIFRDINSQNLFQMTPSIVTKKVGVSPKRSSNEVLQINVDRLC